jgi:hypothetical protein
VWAIAGRQALRLLKILSRTRLWAGGGGLLMFGRATRRIQCIKVGLASAPETDLFDEDDVAFMALRCLGEIAIRGHQSECLRNGKRQMQGVECVQGDFRGADQLTCFKEMLGRYCNPAV